MKARVGFYIHKMLSKQLYKFHTDVLAVQIYREDSTNKIIKILSLLAPIFCIIYNCAYTFQTDILNTLAGYNEVNFVFKLFLYLALDEVLINIGKAFELLIFYYFLLSSIFVAVLLQVYYIRTNKSSIHILTHYINFGFMLIFKVFLMPITDTLMHCVKNRFSSSIDKQYDIPGLGAISLMFLIFLGIMCCAFLLYFIENAYKERYTRFFSCSNPLGEILWIVNSWIVTFSHVFLYENFIWTNLAKIVIHGFCMQLLIIRQPYYNSNTNEIVSMVFCINMLSSVHFLLAYLTSSAYTLIVQLFLVSPCIAYLIKVKVQSIHNDRIKNPREDVEFDWELDVYALRFVESFEKLKKKHISIDYSEKVEGLCEKYEKFIKSSLSKPSKKKYLLKCLFFIYADHSKKAYYELFFSHFQPNNFFSTIQLQKCEKMLSNFTVLEHFYSSYFLLSLKSRKNDLKVCRNLLSLCSELHESYPSLTKINKKVVFLIHFLKTTLKIYGKLMKDYQNQESLEIYGSFLSEILNDEKGRKFINLSKTMNSELSFDNTNNWVLDSSSGFCIFSIEKHEQGAILEMNQNFLEILSIQKEIAPENILSILFPPFDKIAYDIIANKLVNTKKLILLEDCFRFVFDFESLLIDIEVNLLPIRWKKKSCLLFSCKRLNEIKILLSENFAILGISRNFLNNVLGYSNRSTVSQILNTNIGYFLPKFTANYIENGLFDYADENKKKMRITSKSFNYKTMSFIILKISNVRGSIFRQTSMLKTIHRRHTLSIIQFSDAHTTELLDTNKVDKLESKPFQNESSCDSQKLNYEPESFSLSARSKKENSFILQGLDQKIKILKSSLIILYIFSVLSIIGILTFLYFYLISFEEFKTVEKFSYMTSELIEIAFAARNLQLVSLGIISLDTSNYYKELLKNATLAMHEHLDEFYNSDSNLIKNDNSDLLNNVVHLVVFTNGTLYEEKTNLIQALKILAINAETLAASSNWENEEFMMIYINTMDDVLIHALGSLEQISDNFHTQKNKLKLNLMLVIILPQVIISGLFAISFLLPLTQVDKYYKKAVRQIFSIKKDSLLKTSINLIKRMQVYHQETHIIKNTSRNRRPDIHKRWTIYAIIITIILSVYFILLDLLVTAPINSLHRDLEKFTSTDMLQLNIYLYTSYYWAWENHYTNFPSISYYSLQCEYLTVSNISNKIYSINKKIHQITQNFKTNFQNPTIQNFLLNTPCNNNLYCENYFKNGLKGAIDNTVDDINNWVVSENNSTDIFDLVRIHNIHSAVSKFQYLCENYVTEKLNESSYMTICIVLNVFLAIGLVVFYKGFLKRFFKRILLYAKVRIFFKSK
ncbi:hypothetical protein SteCoe_14329 [Stentor coeruleus]|uniref:Uncharacterized protein n=1 Tax=Stentor coeruleus TaxID=5963 RepID=A0A1R2C667_9CILI|nr:hypothetical protein SteCoe_14329 [Stentor coeruleus]